MNYSIKDRVEKGIYCMKNPSDRYSIPVIPVKQGYDTVAQLRPIPSILEGQAQKDAFLMAQWRNHHREAFFTWITASEGKTKEWLRTCYSVNNSDIIFMIESNDGLPFGHIALYNFDFDRLCCELGRVLRGTRGGPKGGMALAAKTLIDWAVITLKIYGLFVEVFENNSQAISLYKRCGFHTVAQIPLRRVAADDMVKWEKIDSQQDPKVQADGFALRMELGVHKE